MVINDTDNTGTMVVNNRGGDDDDGDASGTMVFRSGGDGDASGTMVFNAGGDDASGTMIVSQSDATVIAAEVAAARAKKDGACVLSSLPIPLSVHMCELLLSTTATTATATTSRSNHNRCRHRHRCFLLATAATYATTATTTACSRTSYQPQFMQYFAGNEGAAAAGAGEGPARTGGLAGGEAAVASARSGAGPQVCDVMQCIDFHWHSTADVLGTPFLYRFGFILVHHHTMPNRIPSTTAFPPVVLSTEAFPITSATAHRTPLYPNL
jgi:hypothetical protein